MSFTPLHKDPKMVTPPQYIYDSGALIQWYLITGKFKISPLKRITITRLEIFVILLASLCIKYVWITYYNQQTSYLDWLNYSIGLDSIIPASIEYIRCKPCKSGSKSYYAVDIAKCTNPKQPCQLCFTGAIHYWNA